MEQLAEWLRRIVAAVVLAGFLELLLPKNQLRGVARLVMGLLIITIMLEPLAKVLKMPNQLALSLASVDRERSEQAVTKELIQQGIEWRNKLTGAARDQNETLIKNKIRNVTGLIDEVRTKDIKVYFLNERITGVQLRVTPMVTMTLKVKDRVKEQLVNAVQFITNLEVKAIEVIWE